MKTKLILLISLVLIGCSAQKQIFIADHYVHCQNNQNKKCLLVKQTLTDSWGTFSGNIKEFQYQEGYQYKLKVKPQQNNYVLINILEKNKSPEFVINQNIMNKKWEVETFANFNLDTLSRPYFKIDNEQINGYLGCNNFTGSIKYIDNSKVKINAMMSTRRACIKEVELENQFFNTINNTNTFTQKQNRLYAYNNDQLLFTARVAIEYPKPNDTKPKFTHVVPIQQITYTVTSKDKNTTIIWVDGKIKYQQTTPSNNTSKTILLNAEDNESVKKLIKTIKVTDIPEVKVPSKNYLNGSEPSTTLSFLKWGKVYKSKIFDKSNAPEIFRVIIKKMNNYIVE